MTRPYLLVYDHGTTGIKAVLFDKQGKVKARGYRQFEQIYPKPGWVEHNPDELWSLTLPVAEEALKEAGAEWGDIAGIGLTNQRETVVMWDRETGEPVHNAIVWQCRRTAERCEELKSQGKAEMILEKTGLVLDAYFSGTKVEWLLEHEEKARELMAAGRLCFGTVDSWILWKLSGGKAHVTDVTNASRTLLYNIHDRRWDPELLALFGVDESILPEVKPSNVVYGESQAEYTGGTGIPLAGCAGDQQAALYGQKCWEPGSAKSTYGTGAFVVMNLGDKAITSRQGLLTTLGCDARGNPCYALEGAIFIAGGAIEWLVQRLGVVESPKEAARLARELEDNDGVYFVPAFVGLSAPHWDAEARGLICGLTQGNGPAHLARAAYESMAYQTREVVDAMQQEAELSLDALRVDGGVTHAEFLVRFLADMLNLPVIRTESADVTARGAAYLCGLATGFWESPEAIAALPDETTATEPAMDSGRRERVFKGWRRAVERTLTTPAT